MAVIISINSMTGGTCKTTNVVNLASCFAELKYRTLLVDMANNYNTGLTYCLCKGEEISKDITSLQKNNGTIADDKEINNIIKKVRENIYLIPSTENLEMHLNCMINKEKLLENILNKDVIQKNFDIILIDNNSSFNTSTINSINAADYIIGSSECVFLSVRGISGLDAELSDFKKNIDEVYLGTIGKNIQKSNHLDEAKGILEEDYKLLKPTISRTVKIDEALADGKSIIEYAGKSKVAKEYRALTQTIIEKLKEKNLLIDKINKDIQIPQPINPKAWKCPNCSNVNIGNNCILCGSLKPKKLKKKVVLDDNATEFDYSILEDLDTVENVILNGVSRKNITMKNWMFEYLKNRKTRTESVSDIIEKALKEYIKNDVKEINGTIRECLKNKEKMLDNIIYKNKDAKYVEMELKKSKDKDKNKNEDKQNN